MDSRWGSETISQEEISRRVPESTQVLVSSLLYEERPTALCLSPSILSLCLATHTSSLQPSMACLMHASCMQHSVTHRCMHMQPQSFWWVLSIHINLQSQHIFVPKPSFASSRILVC